MKKLLKALAALGICAATGHASALVLPGINTMSAGQYGDFIVYSLDLLAQCKPLDARCNPFIADPPQLDVVDSSPGQIAPNVVIYAAGDGNLLLNYAAPSGPFGGQDPDVVQVDNNFLPPQGGATTFDMGAGNEPEEPGGGGNPADGWANDNPGTWDAKLSSIVSFLNGADLVFLFDNNQEGGDSPQYFWARLDIRAEDGTLIKSYCLNSNFQFGVFNAASNACATPFDEFTDATDTGSFVSSGGQFCVDKVSGETVLPGGVPPAQKADCDAVNAYFVDNNLGQNSAEFAVLSQDLNANLLNWANLGYFMHIDFKMRGLNDGGEQLWIVGVPRTPPPEVPEPGTLALAALAILLTAAGLRRRQG
jgi:hypothetical protein